MARRPWTRSDGERALRHDDARPADPDLLAAHLHPDPARTSHGVALLDEHGRAVGHQTVCDQAADERTGGAAGRGILRDADGRVEEPGVRDGGRIDGIQAVQVATLGVNLRAGPARRGPSGRARSTTARSRTGTRRCAAPVETTCAGTSSSKSGPPGSNPSARASSSRSVTVRPNRGGACSITIASGRPFRPAISTGRTRPPISCASVAPPSASRSIRPAVASHHKAPSALWPAPTTSAPAGVNERSRQIAPGRVAGSTNVVSDWLN
jgi:hypothetical protein